MNKQKQQFESSFLTEFGTTPTNREYFAKVELANLACWVIAERLDSCVEKESAKLAAEQVIQDFTAHPAMSRVKIKAYLMNAHRTLIAESGKIKLRASLLMVVTDYTKIIWAVAGNIRLYHLRQGKFNFRSKDQTMAQVMLDAGNLTEAELSQRNERNSLINFLGISTEFKPLIAPAYRLQNGDHLLLGNVNLWENLNDVEIAEAWIKAPEANDYVHHLKNVLLAKQPKAHKYIMAAIAIKQMRQQKLSEYEPELRKLAVALPLLLLILTGGLMLWRISTQRPPFQTKPKKTTVSKLNPIKLQQKREQDQTSLTEGNPLVGQQPIPKSEPLQSEPSPVLLKTGVSQAEREIEPQPGKADSAELERAKRAAAEAKKQQESVELERARKAAAEAKKQQESVELERARKAAAKAKKQQETAKLERARKAAAKAKKQQETAKLERAKKAAAEAKKQQETVELERQKKVTAKLERQGKTVAEAKKPKEAAKLAKQKATAKPAEQLKSEIIPEQTVVSTEREQKVKQTQTLEATGDDLYRLEKYSEALKYYKLAYPAYRELGMKEAAVVVDRKINTTIRQKLIFFLQQSVK